MSNLKSRCRMGKGRPLGNVEDGLDPVFEYGCAPFDISKTRVGDSTNFICTEVN